MMRRLVLVDRVMCPRCHRPVFEAMPRAGDLLLDCERKTCLCSWWTIVVPPGATTAYLGTLFGPAAAAAVWRALMPTVPYTAPGVREMPLAPAKARLYLNIEIDRRIKPRSLYVDNDGLAVLAGLLA